MDPIVRSASRLVLPNAPKPWPIVSRNWEETLEKVFKVGSYPAVTPFKQGSADPARHRTRTLFLISS